MSFDAKHNPGALYLKFDEQTDIFATGITFAHLFQEIYVPKPEKREISVGGKPGMTHTFLTFSLLHGTKYAEHPALQKLLKKMVIQNPNNPMTAEELLVDFEVVLATYPDYQQFLAEDRLAAIKADFTPADGAKAFGDIEFELVGFNQRLETINTKLAM